MDHTLAVYKYPQFETLAFNLAIDKLIIMGYPNEIKNYTFNPSFAVRGLWLDKKYGNLLKLDSHRNILVCVHGLKILNNEETLKYYPNRFITYEEGRIYTLDTLYELPLSHLYACVIDFFDSNGKKNE
jgi:5'-nucleotidase